MPTETRRHTCSLFSLTMSTRICTIEGCKQKHAARGLCQTHYSRWRIHGNPHTVIEPQKRFCEIEGCGKPRVGQGLCHKHYTRQRKWGDPNVVRLPKLGCELEGCDGKHFGHGYCSKHYARWRKHGSPDVVIVRPVRTCEIEGCDREHVARDMCRLHYDRWKDHGHPNLVRKPPEPFCKLDGCDQPGLAWDMCQRHYNRARYLANRDMRLQQAAEHRDSNREQINQWHREHYAATREYQSRRSKKWRKANPEKVRAVARVNKARRRGAKRIPFTAEQWAVKVAYWGDRCWLCGSSEWTDMEHIKPIKAGGTHMLANLRPACSPCNSSKGDSWPLPDLLGVHRRRPDMDDEVA